MLKYLCFAVGLAAPLSAWAQDAGRGRLLYETHCATCHAEKLHRRELSKIQSLANLRDEVARWVKQTRHGFTLDDIEAVVQHLNRTHYRLAK